MSATPAAPTPAKDSERRGLAHALLVVALLSANLGVTTIALPRALGIPRGTLFSGTPLAWVVIAAAAAGSLALVVAVALLRGGRLSGADIGWRFDDVIRDFGRGLAGAAACVAILFAALIFVFGATPQEIADALMGFNGMQRGQMLCIGLVAALAEESVFRGRLQPLLAARFGLPVAIVLQAALFSPYHLDFSPPGLALKFLFGVVYGLLRWRDRSLVAPASAHFLFWQLAGFL